MATSRTPQGEPPRGTMQRGAMSTQAADQATKTGRRAREHLLNAWRVSLFVDSEELW